MKMVCFRLAVRTALKKLNGTLAGLVLLPALSLIFTPVSYSQEKIPDEVVEIFENKCAFSGCHAGPSCGNDLNLTANQAYAALVNQPSYDFPKIKLVKAGDPVESYLIMKIVGTSAIKGKRMPQGSEPLSRAELLKIASWIKSLSPDIKPTESKKKHTDSFPGLSLATLQTAQTLPKGGFSYRIAHRWLGRVDAGFGQFFGLDAGAHILTELAFPIWNSFTFTVGRSGTNATFEFIGKWQLMQEKTNGSTPISLALFGGVDWITGKPIPDPANPGQNLGVTDGKRFQWYSQLIMTKHLSNRISLLLSPGVLVNGNITAVGRAPVVTLGFGARYMMSRGFSIFVEGAPILSGSDNALPVGGIGAQNGQPIVYDAFTLGLERNLGGHVFHVYITNSLGLTPAQVMNGGNLDFSKGEFRLGFNIYRVLGL